MGLGETLISRIRLNEAVDSQTHCLAILSSQPNSDDTMLQSDASDTGLM